MSGDRYLERKTVDVSRVMAGNEWGLTLGDLRAFLADAEAAGIPEDHAVSVSDHEEHATLRGFSHIKMIAVEAATARKP